MTKIAKVNVFNVDLFCIFLTLVLCFWWIPFLEYAIDQIATYKILKGGRKSLRAVWTNVDQSLIADQRHFRAKYLKNSEENKTKKKFHNDLISSLLDTWLVRFNFDQRWFRWIQPLNDPKNPQSIFSAKMAPETGTRRSPSNTVIRWNNEISD